MKKIIATLVCGLICLSAIISLAICSVRANYAKEHYKNHYAENKDGIYILSQGSYIKGYGCGEYNCIYCNGGQYKANIEDFVYFNTVNTVKTVSTVVAICSGIPTLILLLLAIPSGKKKEDRERSD